MNDELVTIIVDSMDFSLDSKDTEIISVEVEVPISEVYKTGLLSAYRFEEPLFHDTKKAFELMMDYLKSKENNDT